MKYIVAAWFLVLYNGNNDHTVIPMATEQICQENITQLVKARYIPQRNYALCVPSGLTN